MSIGGWVFSILMCLLAAWMVIESVRLHLDIGRDIWRLTRRRPDYEKIARLEIELGLVDPPDTGPFRRRSYQLPPAARPTQFDPNGFGWKTYGVRDKPKRAPNGHHCWAPGPGECYSDCGIMSWGQCPQRPKE